MFDNKAGADLPRVRRLAGESVREKRETLIDEHIVPIIFVPLLLWLVFVLEQYQASSHSPPQPRLWLCLAIAATGVAAVWFRRLIPRARRLNRGELGERVVADVLEELRIDGYKPVHDIVADRFNIDHVLVGPGGVFAIETKFRSGYGEITFRNGEGLFVGGFSEEKDCLKQARGNAKAVSQMIANNCRRHEWVTPLLVFVGNWRVKDDWRDTETRVFTPDGLARYIRNQQPLLKKSEIDLIASHLERSSR
jgi:nuclease-like protein